MGWEGSGRDHQTMRIGQQVFSAHVELPCRIFCGPGSMLEVPGTAVKLGPASVHLQVSGGSWHPVVGEQLRLELALPVHQNGSGDGTARNLSVRATVAEVTEQPDGSRALELRFRKPVFKDRISRNGHAEEAAAPVKWKM